MILGLIFMVISWYKTNDMKYLLGGMVFISVVGDSENTIVTM